MKILDILLGKTENIEAVKRENGGVVLGRVKRTGESIYISYRKEDDKVVIQDRDGWDTLDAEGFIKWILGL